MAVLNDLLILAKGQKPFMCTMVRKMQQSANDVKMFTMRRWQFERDNFKELIKAAASAKDGQEFNCDVEKVNWNNYFEQAILGLRRYIFKDDESTMDSSRKKLQK